MLNALEGIRVIDLSHVIAGPTTSHYLRLLGADVVKIEHPSRGDALRYSGRQVEKEISEAFAAINAGKQSLAVDLRHPRIKQFILDRAEQADVFIENFRPGAMKRLGLDYSAVTAVNPNIVYASISGFGQEGEWRSRGAYDHIVQAATGMMMCNGSESDPPMKVGFPLVDTATGMLGGQAILAALLRRLRTGKGAYLDISMAQAAVQLMLTQMARAYSRQQDMPRVGNTGFTGSPGSTVFECINGWLAVAANTPVQFRTLCELLAVPQLPFDPNLILQDENQNRGFVKAIDPAKVKAALSAKFSERNADDLEALLNQTGVPASKVRTPLEFLNDVVKTNKITLGMQEVDYTDGTLCGFPPGFTTPFEVEPSEVAYGRAPDLGGDSADKLLRSGFSVEELIELETAGAIRTVAEKKTGAP
ncbi:CaiB/BaiF CoA transferase family protein [Allopusillimonas ginsengisoli]|uniref:CaiB/BaiF CoA transferase family protein n=1 Tax=Allopusillimonas ginsengisoli TaxID=453575 RepID=UPI0010223CA8|nr:CoA transferase [Allopusillimonas ginsengisoli]TEA79475.1 CoA transferase [Allopusillimonas ginsengisoli]